MSEWWEYVPSCSDVNDEPPFITSVSPLAAVRAAEETRTEVKEVLIYPNPASTRITIQAAAEIGSEREVQLIDAGGRSYLAKFLRKTSNRSLELDISHLPKGVYFIRFRQDAKLKSVRFIKL